MYQFASRRQTTKSNSAIAAPAPAPRQQSGARWNLTGVPAFPAAAAARVQPKLRIGAVNDPAEHEADRVADRVMGSAGPVAAPATRTAAGVNRKCGGCGEEEAQRQAVVPPVVRLAGGAAAAAGQTASAAAETAVNNLGSGASLPAADRAFFESRFDRDFSHVRIHDGQAADTASRAMAARAFTLGSDIAFADGAYRPGTGEGRRLIAHELTHVLQGNGSVIRAKCDGSPAECAADKLEAAKKISADKGYSKFVYKAATHDKDTKGCYRPTDIAQWIKDKDPGLFEGLLSHYIDQAVEPVNELTKKSAKSIHVGDCFAFPYGWKDPAIGDVAAELKRLNKKENVKIKNDVIATIYAERSDKAPQMDEQRKYIFYAMLLRIKGAEWGATFEEVVTPGTFHGKKPVPKTEKSTTYWDNYLPALKYLETPAPETGKGKAKEVKPKEVAKEAKAPDSKPSKAEEPESKTESKSKGKGKKKKKVEAPKPINKEAIGRLGKSIEGTTEKDIPTDAGPYYFHWSEDTTTAENEYDRLLAPHLKKPAKTAAEKAALKAAQEEAEKKAAYKHAKDVVGASMAGIKEADGWLKKIPGPKGNGRYGSMYIYK